MRHPACSLHLPRRRRSSNCSGSEDTRYDGSEDTGCEGSVDTQWEGSEDTRYGVSDDCQDREKLKTFLEEQERYQAPDIFHLHWGNTGDNLSALSVGDFPADDK